MGLTEGRAMFENRSAPAPIDWDGRKLTALEVGQLMAAAKNGDADARQKLAEHNLTNDQ